MKNWDYFEIECVNYLQGIYSGVTFNIMGGNNSAVSDIQVIKNKTWYMTIECKMSEAQSGQFVLYPDYDNKCFTFSSKNKTPYTDTVKVIIDNMNRYFDEYSIPSTKVLPLSESVISQWVKDYYINVKQAKYCITKSNTGFLIFPIDKMDDYFTFTAHYRVKNSGSSRPSKKNEAEINSLLESLNINAHVEFINKGCYVKFNHSDDEFVLSGEKYRYKFSKDGDTYKVRRLSNTRNANFIVSIKLKKFEQDMQDLLTFENDLMRE